MIGDALETDITGGTMAGIDTCWVLLDGIHSSELIMTHDDNNNGGVGGGGGVDDAESSDSGGGTAAGVAKNKDSNNNRLLEQAAGTVLETFNNKKGTYAKDRELAPTMLLKHFCW